MSRDDVVELLHHVIEFLFIASVQVFSVTAYSLDSMTTGNLARLLDEHPTLTDAPSGCEKVHLNEFVDMSVSWIDQLKHFGSDKASAILTSLESVFELKYVEVSAARKLKVAALP